MINIVYLPELDNQIFSENLSSEADGDPQPSLKAVACTELTKFTELSISTVLPARVSVVTIVTAVMTC